MSIEAYAWWKASVEINGMACRLKPISAINVINILARWLMSRINGADVADAAAKAVAELHAIRVTRGNKLLSDTEANEFLARVESLYFGPKYDSILNEVRADSEGRVVTAVVNTRIDTVEIQYMDFRMVIDRGHFKYLNSLQQEVQVIAAQLMYYEGCNSHGQSWAYPAYIRAMEHRCMPPIKHVIEAFASPFNLQLPNILEFSHNRGLTGQYCSIMPGDKQLGSLGSFFDLDIVADCTCLLVNPPFIEKILLQAAQKCISALKLAKMAGRTLSVIFITPEWRDAAAYIVLRTAAFRKYDKVMFKNTYSYEEQFTSRKIPTKFNSHLWLLSNV